MNHSSLVDSKFNNINSILIGYTILYISAFILLVVIYILISLLISSAHKYKYGKKPLFLVFLPLFQTYYLIKTAFSIKDAVAYLLISFLLGLLKNNLGVLYNIYFIIAAGYLFFCIWKCYLISSDGKNEIAINNSNNRIQPNNVLQPNNTNQNNTVNQVPLIKQNTSTKEFDLLQQSTISSCKICVNCGNKLYIVKGFCPNCGTKIPE